MSKALIGNLLILSLLILSFLFFLVSIEGRAFESGFMMLVFLLFYFLGKGIYYNSEQKVKNNSYFIKALIILVPIAIPLTVSLLYKSINFSLVSSFIAFFLIAVGIDYKGYIDSALEGQVYKEIPQSYNSLYLILYVVLAIALIIFFPYM